MIFFRGGSGSHLRGPLHAAACLFHPIVSSTTESMLAAWYAVGAPRCEPALVHHFGDPSPVRAVLVRRFSADVELIELVLYSTYAIAEVSDARNSGHVSYHADGRLDRVVDWTVSCLA